MDLWVYIFDQVWKNFSHYFFTNRWFFSVPFSFSSPPVIPFTCILDHLILPQISLRLWFFFSFLLNLHASFWIIFIAVFKFSNIYICSIYSGIIYLVIFKICIFISRHFIWLILMSSISLIMTIFPDLIFHGNATFTVSQFMFVFIDIFFLWLIIANIFLLLDKSLIFYFLLDFLCLYFVVFL